MPPAVEHSCSGGEQNALTIMSVIQPSMRLIRRPHLGRFGCSTVQPEHRSADQHRTIATATPPPRRGDPDCAEVARRVALPGGAAIRGSIGVPESAQRHTAFDPVRPRTPAPVFTVRRDRGHMPASWSWSTPGGNPWNSCCPSPGHSRGGTSRSTPMTRLHQMVRQPSLSTPVAASPSALVPSSCSRTRVRRHRCRQYLHQGDARWLRHDHDDIKARRPCKATKGRDEPWPRHPAPVG